MNSTLRVQAESRLLQAAEAAGLADPRPPLRERLRHLREAHPAAFASAVEHYEQQVLPALAGADPLAAWVDYGGFIGGLTANGRMTAVDGTGRATAFRPPPRPAGLVLFVPEDTATPVLPVLTPTASSPAQAATLRLLVDRKLDLAL